MEILSDVASECSGRCDKMRKSLEANDLNAYRIDAHTIKGSMATIGMKAFSERAKKHEFAARDNDADFVQGDADAFLNEYAAICGKLREVLEEL
jgi:HPt (histidine-containing phosphotransfer) domain-containing protein